MAESLIKWRKYDNLRLGQAVARYNKKLKELGAVERGHLPDYKEFKDVKNNIMSRKELNRVINSLNKITKEGMTKMVELPSGQMITKWEYSEIKLARNRAIKTLSSESESIKQGKIWVGMGDERLDQIEDTIENMKDIENLRGYDFKRTEERIIKLGENDLSLKRAQTFRDNFMRSLEEMSGYENYDKLYNKLANIRNPIQFYEYVRQSETLMDLFLFYKDKATSSTWGGFSNNQAAFNYALDELGIRY